MVAPSVQAVVLAAGKSSRFRTDQSKLTYIICGQEMVLYSAQLLKKLSIPTTYVLGYQKEQIKEIFKKKGFHDLSLVEQQEQRGTGHALLCTQSNWEQDHILVMNGDMPLITPEIIQELVQQHLTKDAAVSFVTAYHPDPKAPGYGRVVEENGKIKIVEAIDCQTSCETVCCINAGIYLFKKSFLLEALPTLSPHHKTGELHITDLIESAAKNALTVATTISPFDHVRGINTLKELWTAEHIKRSELISYWMDHGVRFSTAHNVHIDIDVTIGAGTYIGAGVLLTNGTRIGAHCLVDAYSFLQNCSIEDNVTVLTHSVIIDSHVKSFARVGPFAHIRSNSIIGDHTVIGNFVEVSQTSVGNYTKAKHLTYLGNAHIGSSVNIGAGTITCNYDGFSKHTTTIEDNAKIGALNSLVAPITIGKDAITGAGSTLTETVPADSLAIARAPQVNKLHYAEKLRKRHEEALHNYHAARVESDICDEP